jgi:DNA-binding response OmpR family regulator
MFALLEYLMLHAGRPLTRAEIERHVWGESGSDVPTSLPVFINYLRKKLDIGCRRKLIRSIRGVGYQLGEGDERMH